MRYTAEEAETAIREILQRPIRIGHSNVTDLAKMLPDVLRSFRECERALDSAARQLDTMPDLGVPADGIVINHVAIASYLTEDGQNAYAVGTKGDGTMSTYLGLLVIGQDEVLGWAKGPRSK